MRFRKIEFRWSKTNNRYELIQWYKSEIDENKEYCCVIAFFHKDKEGYYDMQTIGSRFFEDKDAWFVGKHAIEFLNDISQELKKEEYE